MGFLIYIVQHVGDCGKRTSQRVAFTWSKEHIIPYNAIILSKIFFGSEIYNLATRMNPGRVCTKEKKGSEAFKE